MPQPSVVRNVHYVSYGTPGGEYSRECRAAIVTEVDTPDAVGLAVLNPAGIFFTRGTPRHDGDVIPDGEPHIPHLCDGKDYPGGTWHWPGRTPE